ncbi:MAG: hypothetical protein ACE1ZM_07925, partial [Gammaproteobacteria bacterium]
LFVIVSSPELSMPPELSAKLPEIVLSLIDADASSELRIPPPLAVPASGLTSPNNNNALNKYLSILMIDEGNTEAIEGIQSISDKYISLAYGAMKSNNLAKADVYIEKAKTIYSKSNKVAPARIALQEKYTEQKTTETTQLTEKSSEEMQQVGNEEEESEGIWDSIKKWNEKNENTQYEESDTDRTIKKHFNL